MLHSPNLASFPQPPQFAIEDYGDELAGLLAIADRSHAVQLIRSRYRSSGGKGRSSRYRGVSLHASGRWEARITLGAGSERRYKVRRGRALGWAAGLWGCGTLARAWGSE